MSSMSTIEATLTTARAAPYAAQLGRHASAMAGERGHRMRPHGGGNPLAAGEVTLRVDQSVDRTVLVFDPWGSCTVRVEGKRLALRIDAADELGLQRIQQIITGDIERFGAREHLSLAWPDSPARSASTSPDASSRRGRPATAQPRRDRPTATPPPAAAGPPTHPRPFLRLAPSSRQTRRCGTAAANGAAAPEARRTGHNPWSRGLTVFRALGRRAPVLLQYQYRGRE